nr:recombinase family protein [Microvirga tunisiensis]
MSRSGRSYRRGDIAHGLNRDGLRPPRGRVWNASTINGNAERGTGVLNNDLYGGRLVWNRLRMIKDPHTGKRVSRPNPENQWQIVEVPELVIVPKDLYEAVRQKKTVRCQAHPSQQKRQRHLPSGLLRCGCCGAAAVVPVCLLREPTNPTACGSAAQPPPRAALPGSQDFLPGNRRECGPHRAQERDAAPGDAGGIREDLS